MFNRRNEPRKKNVARLYDFGFIEKNDPDSIVEMELPTNPGALLDRYYCQTAASYGASGKGVTTEMPAVSFGGSFRVFSDPEHTT